MVPPSEKAGPITIPVVFHVIVKDDTPQGGNIPNEQIYSQIQVLNSLYHPAGISFVLAGTTRTKNSTWFNHVADKTDEQTEMKNKLRVGNAGTLNVYTVGRPYNIPGPRGTAIGYAPFPWDYARNPQDDGVVIRFNTLPRGSYLGYNSGKNLVHEVGHWAGLYHTFQGGCEGYGDYVDDTPPQRNSTHSLGCPYRNASCRRGVFDPVDNYMDYSNEFCKTRFTSGQISRMNGMLRMFRYL